MYLSSGTRQGGCMSSPAQGLPGGVRVAFDAGEPAPMVTVRSLLLCCLLCVIVHGAAESERLCGSPSAIGGIVPSVCRAVWCSLLDRL